VKKVLFIVNPVSGTSNRKVWVDKAKESLKESFDVIVKQTQYRGHGNEIAADAVKEGVDIVVAVGGDGTVNEIGSAVVGSKSQLAIFPMGSGNGLARELGMSTKSANKAIDTIINGSNVAVDYGIVDNKPFFCTCGTGFDAEIARLFTTNTKRGFWQYLKLSIKSYFTFKPIDIKFVVDGVENKRSVFLFNAANIKQYGFGAQIAPKASVYDGLLDITIVPKINIFTALKLTYGMFTRKLDRMKPIETFKCSSLTLEMADGAPFHIDGDYVKPSSSKLTIKAIKGGIGVLV